MTLLSMSELSRRHAHVSSVAAEENSRETDGDNTALIFPSLIDNRFVDAVTGSHIIAEIEEYLPEFIEFSLLGENRNYLRVNSLRQLQSEMQRSIASLTENKGLLPEAIIKNLASLRNVKDTNSVFNYFGTFIEEYIRFRQHHYAGNASPQKVFSDVNRQQQGVNPGADQTKQRTDLLASRLSGYLAQAFALLNFAQATDLSSWREAENRARDALIAQLLPAEFDAFNLSERFTEDSLSGKSLAGRKLNSLIHAETWQEWRLRQQGLAPLAGVTDKAGSNWPDMLSALVASLEDEPAQPAGGMAITSASGELALLLQGIELTGKAATKLQKKGPDATLHGQEPDFLSRIAESCEKLAALVRELHTATKNAVPTRAFLKDSPKKGRMQKMLGYLNRAGQAIITDAPFTFRPVEKVAWRADRVLTAHFAKKTERLKAAFGTYSLTSEEKSAVLQAGGIIKDLLQQAMANIQRIAAASEPLFTALAHQSALEKLLAAGKTPGLDSVLAQRRVFWQTTVEEEKRTLKALIKQSAILSRHGGHDNVQHFIRNMLSTDAHSQGSVGILQDVSARLTGYIAYLASLETWAAELPARLTGLAQEERSPLIIFTPLLRQMEAARSLLNVQISQLTGREPGSFSRSGMLARGIAIWQQERKKQWLQNQPVAGQKTSGDQYDAAFLTLIKDYLPLLAKQHDENGGVLLQRIKTEMINAAAGTTLYPVTMAEMLATQKGMNEVLKNASIRSLIRLGFSAMFGSVKLMPLLVTLPLQIVVRSLLTGARLAYVNHKDVAAVKLGEGSARLEARQYRRNVIGQGMAKTASGLARPVQQAAGLVFLLHDIYQGDASGAAGRVGKELPAELAINSGWDGIRAVVRQHIAEQSCAEKEQTLLALAHLSEDMAAANDAAETEHRSIATDAHGPVAEGSGGQAGLNDKNAAEASDDFEKELDAIVKRENHNAPPGSQPLAAMLLAQYRVQRAAGEPPLRMVRSASAKESQFSYDRSGGVITLRSAADEQEVLHESAHALTGRRLDAGLLYPDSRAGKVCVKLASLQAKAAAVWREKGEVPPELDVFLSNSSDKEVALHEFVAGVYSNAALRAFLADSELNGTDLWTLLIKLLCQLLGLAREATGVLFAAEQAGEELMGQTLPEGAGKERILKYGGGHYTQNHRPYIIRKPGKQPFNAPARTGIHSGVNSSDGRFNTKRNGWRAVTTINKADFNLSAGEAAEYRFSYLRNGQRITKEGRIRIPAEQRANRKWHTYFGQQLNLIIREDDDLIGVFDVQYRGENGHGVTYMRNASHYNAVYASTASQSSGHAFTWNIAGGSPEQGDVQRARWDSEKMSVHSGMQQKDGDPREKSGWRALSSLNMSDFDLPPRTKISYAFSYEITESGKSRTVVKRGLITPHTRVNRDWHYDFSRQLNKVIQSDTELNGVFNVDMLQYKDSWSGYQFVGAKASHHNNMYVNTGHSKGYKNPQFSWHLEPQSLRITAQQPGSYALPAGTEPGTPQVTSGEAERRVVLATGTETGPVPASQDDVQKEVDEAETHEGQLTAMIAELLKFTPANEPVPTSPLGKLMQSETDAFRFTLQKYSLLPGSLGIEANERNEVRLLAAGRQWYSQLNGPRQREFDITVAFFWKLKTAPGFADRARRLMQDRSPELYTLPDDLIRDYKNAVSAVLKTRAGNRDALYALRMEKYDELNKLRSELYLSVNDRVTSSRDMMADINGSDDDVRDTIARRDRVKAELDRERQKQSAENAFLKKYICQWEKEESQAVVVDADEEEAAPVTSPLSVALSGKNINDWIVESANKRRLQINKNDLDKHITISWRNANSLGEEFDSGSEEMALRNVLLGEFARKVDRAPAGISIFSIRYRMDDKPEIADYLNRHQGRDADMTTTLAIAEDVQQIAMKAFDQFARKPGVYAALNKVIIGSVMSVIVREAGSLAGQDPVFEEIVMHYLRQAKSDGSNLQAVRFKGKTVPGLVAIGQGDFRTIFSLHTGKIFFYNARVSDRNLTTLIREHVAEVDRESVTDDNVIPWYSESFATSQGVQIRSHLQTSAVDFSQAGSAFAPPEGATWTSVTAADIKRVRSDVDGLIYTSRESRAKHAADWRESELSALRFVLGALTFAATAPEELLLIAGLTVLADHESVKGAQEAASRADRSADRIKSEHKAQFRKYMMYADAITGSLLPVALTASSVREFAEDAEKCVAPESGAKPVDFSRYGAEDLPLPEAGAQMPDANGVYSVSRPDTAETQHFIKENGKFYRVKFDDRLGRKQGTMRLVDKNRDFHTGYHEPIRRNSEGSGWELHIDTGLPGGNRWWKKGRTRNPAGNNPGVSDEAISSSSDSSGRSGSYRSASALQVNTRPDGTADNVAAAGTREPIIPAVIRADLSETEIALLNSTEEKLKSELGSQYDTYLLKPKEKCADAATEAAKVLRYNGYSNVKIHEVAIWPNGGANTSPANHYIVMAQKEGVDIVVDLTAGQFSMYNFNGPIISTRHEWLYLWQQAMAEKKRTIVKIAPLKGGVYTSPFNFNSGNLNPQKYVPDAELLWCPELFISQRGAQR